MLYNLNLVFLIGVCLSFAVSVPLECLIIAPIVANVREGERGSGLSFNGSSCSDRCSDNYYHIQFFAGVSFKAVAVSCMLFDFG